MDDHKGQSSGAEVHASGSSSVAGIDGSTNPLQDDEIIGNLTRDSVLSMQFDTLGDAERFYLAYARCHGFGIRMDALLKNKHGEPTARRMVCSAQGRRDEKHIEKSARMREHKSLTRFVCKAGLRVRFVKETGKWHVYRFDDDHSHDLLGARHTPLHRCHRNLSDADKAQVGTMHGYGFTGSSIYGFIAGQSGGYDKAGFTKKDMYNHISKMRLQQTVDGDAMAALHYLRGKGDNDHDFFMKYTVDLEGRLQHLFWADGNSKLDYKCFGDVVAFDTTYKKNKYNKPFVIFSGVNHHRNTIIFACALVADETEETYKWILRVLLEAMNGKAPLSVITDSDKAMRNAIKVVFPKACHRLCAWHLERNATSNVASNEFTRAFKDCMFADITVAQFESKWSSMVESLGLQENCWVQKIYRKRTMWASAYLRGKLFVGLRTTSMCESINAWLKRYIRHGHNLVDFLHHFHRGLSYLRYNELVADFKSTHGEPVLTTALESIERCGANAYTREAFWIFRREIKLSATCVLAGCTQRVTTRTYKVRRFLHPDTLWNVHIDWQDDVRIICECGMLPSFGIPCHHILFVMVQEDLGYLPQCLIVARWRQTAKVVGDSTIDDGEEGENLISARFGTLMQDCRLLCNVASRSRDNFLKARDNIRSLTNEFQSIQSKPNEAGDKGDCQRILDPSITHSKGRPATNAKAHGKRKKHCGICRAEGHTRVTCPVIRSSQSCGSPTKSQQLTQDYSQPDSQPDHIFEHNSPCHDFMHVIMVCYPSINIATSYNSYPH